jgi:predicted esterase YcpF (UPF0227 family)
MANKSKKLTAVFVHGFNGSHNSTTGRVIKDFLSDYVDVVTDDFNLLSPSDTLRKIDRLVTDNHADILIGISLGAFYTLAYYSMPKIVINPCMFPSVEIPKLDSSIDSKVIEEWKSLESKMYDVLDWEDKKYTVGIFADNDELFSYKDFFKNKYGKIVFIPGGHHAGKNVEVGLDSAIDMLDLANGYKDYSKEEFALYREQDAYEAYKNMLDNFNETKLTETMISVVTKNDKDKVTNYGKQIYDMLVDGYRSIGGLKDCNSYEEFIDNSDFWKICTVKGIVEAVCVYKFKYGGRKLIYATAKKGADGKMTNTSKEALIKIMYEDMNRPGPQGKSTREVWAEVSGALEHMYIKYAKANIIPPNIVQELLSNKKLSVSNDGNHYTRSIGDSTVEKVCVGHAPSVK